MLGKDAFELLEDIYSASEMAIQILNDLLHYEHMDAGMSYCTIGLDTQILLFYCLLTCFHYTTTRNGQSGVVLAAAISLVVQ